MKFLITGSTGQLGREWIQFLNEKDLSFRAFSSVEMDITDSQKVDQKVRDAQPDVVINCAAYTDVDGAENESEKAFLVNKSGVGNLVKACESVGAKLVHYSTDYVFSGSKQDLKNYPTGYPEGAEPNPINVYGKSKAAGEEILQEANCEWMLIRVSWLCGRFGNNFVKTMLRLGIDQNKLKVVNDQIGCPSFTFDVVGKTYQLLEKKSAGIFHISCKGRISWADFAEEIFEQVGLEGTVDGISSDEYPFTATRPMFSLLLNDKARKLGLETLSWKVGLSQLLEQVNEHES